HYPSALLVHYLLPYHYAPPLASLYLPFFFSSPPPPTEIYTLSLHDALPIFEGAHPAHFIARGIPVVEVEVLAEGVGNAVGQGGKDRIRFGGLGKAQPW